LKKLVVLAMLLGSGGAAAVLAAQHLQTHPNPQALLKRVFPAAAAFSPRTGNPPHFKAYPSDPQQTAGVQPIGFAFWTTDVVPREVGYHGPILMLVGVDLSGRITGVWVEHHSEPYGDFSVEPPRFAAQFKGKNIRDMFLVARDVDYVSRATITTSSAARAIRDGSRLLARQLLRPSAVTTQ
jgi:transcriptional regulator of nitric oxide reductase